MPWQFRHHVVIRLGGAAVPPNAGQPVNRGNINLNRLMQHIVEIQLTEYALRGGSGASNLWRVSFRGSNFTEEVSTNAAGDGHLLTIPSLVNTHVVYQMPRILSTDVKQGITHLNVHVMDEFGAEVTFTDMTLYLTFIMNDPHWTIPQVIAEDHNRMDWWRTQQFSSRFPNPP